MTISGQNFSTHQGDTENITVVLDLSETPSMDIETCNFRWVAYRHGNIVLDKVTASGIVADNTDGTITISIERDETKDLVGHYYHICKMVDVDNNEYTPFTGTLEIYESII